MSQFMNWKEEHVGRFLQWITHWGKLNAEEGKLRQEQARQSDKGEQPLNLGEDYSIWQVFLMLKEISKLNI